MAWSGGSRPAAGCVFCSARDGADDRASLVLLRGPHAFLILNAYPYASGHLMAVVNRHVAALGEARPEELTDAMTLVQRAVTALTAEYRAEGFNVGLNQGTTSGGTVAIRKLTSGSATLDYLLFSDSGRTANWGNTVGTDTVAKTGNGSAQSTTVYGRIPAQTSPAPGAYSDTVTVTVTF